MAGLKHPETPIRVLLGGGIGSGKSIAGQRLEDLGAVVLEADRLGHAVLEADGEAFEAVSERWPSVVVNSRIDRRVLAEFVFADPEELIELEAMTHPPIINRISEIAASANDLIVEIPLILDIPGDWTKVFVDAEEEARVRRAVERGDSENDVRRRIASQPLRDEWLAWADEIIDNTGSTNDLKNRIVALWYGLRTTDYGLRNNS
jgi:dephospho-CoA kinase